MSQPGQERREEIHRFICEYYEEHRMPPTIREIMAGIGINSTSSVAYHIRKLVADERLVRIHDHFAARNVVPRNP